MSFKSHAFGVSKVAGLCLLAGSMVTATLQASALEKDDPAFISALERSNFMPTLMQVVMQNAEDLNLSDEQVKAFKQYHHEHSPEQRADMLDVVAHEKKAAQYALEGDLVNAQRVGQESIALRQTIFNQKYRCHGFMQSNLSAEQYEKLLEIAAE